MTDGLGFGVKSLVINQSNIFCQFQLFVDFIVIVWRET